ncbi:neurotrophin receptor-interacting factor homolog [Sitodiplosis mosellana]|uniref:neurotrophin receptor-interacting factor homolog n=1 Tax=Sitodiplosis mosellana TaxID=263140 RepID=UPI002443927A|nr:neurotrophin receptor-interacting factor homolog [Sitodiplosis mosellana]
METIESLRFVIDTLPKIEIMIKILKDVTFELYRTQLMAYGDAVACQINMKEQTNTIGDDLLKKISNTNVFSGDMSLGNITTLLNLYLNNTIVARDSIMTTGNKLERLDKPNGLNDPINNGSNIAAQNSTQTRFSSISANFQIRESINTALIGDSSIVADCTNNFIEKIDQNEIHIKQDAVADFNVSTVKIPEPELKQNESSINVGKITKRKRRVKEEASTVEKCVENLPIKPTKIEDIVTDIGVPDSNDIREETDDPKDIEPVDMSDLKLDNKTESAREERIARRRRRIRISVHRRNSRRTTLVLVRKSIVIDAKPYKCSVSGCTYAGTKKQYLSRHMKTHSKETLFACEKCPKQFREKNALDEHIHEHDEKTEFSCSICNKIFDTEVKKNRHEKKCEKQPSSKVAKNV